MPKKFYENHVSKCNIKYDPELFCFECGKQCKDLKHYNNHKLHHKYKQKFAKEDTIETSGENDVKMDVDNVEESRQDGEGKDNITRYGPGII